MYATFNQHINSREHQLKFKKNKYVNLMCQLFDKHPQPDQPDQPQKIHQVTQDVIVQNKAKPPKITKKINVFSDSPEIQFFHRSCQ